MARWLAAMAATILVAVSAASTVAGTDPFRGQWSAIDIDGSRMQVSFSGSGQTRAVSLVDRRSTVCGGIPQSATGEGVVGDDQIDITGTIACAGSVDAEDWTATFVHDAASAKLFDGFVVWGRGDAGLEAFLGTWSATDVDGSSMSLQLGGSGLTRSVVLVDDLATGACEPDAAITLKGDGLIGSVLGDGRFIAVDISGRCAGGGAFVSAVSKFEYDASTNTLVGPLEPLEIGASPTAWTVVWHR
jgi:hypothetical protein